MSDGELLRKIYALIHPDTTPDGNDVSDGELLDIIFELIEEHLNANNS